ncbi:hypothetical protein G7Y89_g13285 [Cudoniella acicularis]|uniref:Uncharacterized protein n=1 Tax=Cudoniella acicularis TaxID=354080 RepID=A0A8H4VYU9_9HELO|nr:hypothetical protein G7Y89_g13285 [Cudoniella acicularis]
MAQLQAEQANGTASTSTLKSSDIANGIPTVPTFFSRLTLNGVVRKFSFKQVSPKPKWKTFVSREEAPATTRLGSKPVSPTILPGALTSNLANSVDDSAHRLQISGSSKSNNTSAIVRHQSNTNTGQNKSSNVDNSLPKAALLDDGLPLPRQIDSVAAITSATELERQASVPPLAQPLTEGTTHQTVKIPPETTSEVQVNSEGCSQGHSEGPLLANLPTIPKAESIVVPTDPREQIEPSLSPEPPPVRLQGRWLGSEFVEIGKNMYEATRIQPEERLRKCWTEVWRANLKKQLIDLHLGPNAVTNVRLALVGNSPNRESMKPTILLICPQSFSKRKEIQNRLGSCIETFSLATVDIRVVAGVVKLSSDSGSQVLLVSDKKGLEVEVDHDIGDGLGWRARVRVGISRLPWATIGGIIQVEDHLYAMTVAHSMFNEPMDNLPSDSNTKLRCGYVDHYEWSGNSNGDDVGVDWMLIDILENLHFSNQYFIPGSTEPRELRLVSNIQRTQDFADGEVLVCAGSSGNQAGFLSAAPSSILFGDTFYDVFSLSLEAPLADGDSGSWVVKDEKVWGMIFARLEGLPWAYMLPIEQIFDRIALSYSKSQARALVKIPDLTSELRDNTKHTIFMDNGPLLDRHSHLTGVLESTTDEIFNTLEGHPVSIPVFHPRENSDRSNQTMVQSILSREDSSDISTITSYNHDPYVLPSKQKPISGPSRNIPSNASSAHFPGDPLQDEGSSSNYKVGGSMKNSHRVEGSRQLEYDLLGGSEGDDELTPLISTVRNSRSGRGRAPLESGTRFSSTHHASIFHNVSPVPNALRCIINHLSSKIEIYIAVCLLSIVVIGTFGLVLGPLKDSHLSRPMFTVALVLTPYFLALTLVGGFLALRSVYLEYIEKQKQNLVHESEAQIRDGSDPDSEGIRPGDLEEGRLVFPSTAS